MNKIEIRNEPGPGFQRFHHLEPVVEFLLQSGNMLSGGKRWKQTPSGWLCVFDYPIDFQRLRETFQFPDTIALNDKDGVIACEKTWATIMGGKMQ